MFNFHGKKKVSGKELDLTETMYAEWSTRLLRNEFFCNSEV